MGPWRISAHITTIKQTDIMSSTCGCLSMGAHNRTSTHHHRAVSKRPRASGLNTIPRPLDKCQ
jgi:hypothetical protein